MFTKKADLKCFTKLAITDEYKECQGRNYDELGIMSLSERRRCNKLIPSAK